MVRSFRTICSVALALALLNACSKPPPPPPPDITVTPDPKQIPADGTATSTITVSRPDGQPVNLHASKGTFTETNTNSIDFKSGHGTATLIACDSRVKETCSGTSSLAASSDDGASGSATVTFLQLEICDNGRDDNKDGKIDCQDTAVCNTKPCKLFGQDAGAPDLGTCDSTGQCVCATGVVEICDDHIDNNCDGLIDCAQTSCDGKSCRQGNGAGGICTGGSCNCAANEICNNGVDDNCDGLADCNDPQCQAKGSTVGQVCDTRTGLTCSVAGADGGTCSICPLGSSPETICGDNKDNDCDGFTDCADSDCAGKACGSGNGFVCNPDGGTIVANGCGCSGNGGVAEVTESTCGDRKDNDCDGLIDCADPDCLASGGRVCDTFGRKCTVGVGGPGCNCGAQQEDCRTPIDDDCNGLINCADPACQPGTGPGKACDYVGNICSAALGGNPSTCSICTANPKEATEGITGGASLTCGDSIDNDCNGKTDCADPSCTGKFYNSFGAVCLSNGSPGCPSGLTNEVGLCNDGIDNDCDGKIDCADSDCQPNVTNPDGGLCGSGNGYGCISSGICACKGNGGVAQVTETTCNDGFDNDCDGKTDCADTDCRPVGNNLGKVCDGVGDTCAIPTDAGVSRCTVCSGNGGVPQTAEVACGDGFDNDCDGLIDCQDPDCGPSPDGGTGGLSCSPTGKRCTAAKVCACPSGQTTETQCADGLDNDCDGLIDCADPDCQPSASAPGKSCSATGGICNAGGACACSGNGGVAETSEGNSNSSPATCGDGKDNDCDGLVDCADPDCRLGAGVGSYGINCSTATRIGVKCDVTGVCTCPGGQIAESTCGDGLDNDCDGLVDCADPDCLSKSCSGTGKACSVTSSAGCTCPTGTTESSCMDNIDNDCNGLVDCADPACQGTAKQCNIASNQYQCSLQGPTWVCKDQSSNYTVTLSTTRSAIPADGAATATITANLKYLGGNLSGKTITFTVTGGGTVSPTSATTDVNGNAVTTFTAGMTFGTATITGTYDTSGTGAGPNVYGTTTVGQPRIGQVKFNSQQYSVMGVMSSSFQETNQISFLVLDTNNQPYPAGLSVAFSHQQISSGTGSSYIGSVPNCTLGTCTATGVTDPAGQVSVLLHSGTAAGVAAVSARASAGGATGNASASNIAIVGAKANGLYLTLDCTPKNVAAFSNTTCANSQYNSTITCRASFADRFNHVLGVPTTATFMTEAGGASQPSSTPPYGSGNQGQAFGSVTVQGYSLPVDVAPYLTGTGEYSLAYTDTCGTATHNPRDGLVTIIVQANGEEGFVDGSGTGASNGQYDVGEYFVDQGEPFVDVNDNGLRDSVPNEPYVDVNANGVYDGPNGVWDSNTVIWAETRVLYSGFAKVLTTAGPTDNVSRFYQLNPADPKVTGAPAAPPAPSAQPRFTLTHATTQTATVGLLFADSNFNYPTSQTSYGLSVISGTESATFTTAPSQIDQLGLSFTQQYCSNKNGTGTCNPTQCLSAPCFLVSNVGTFSYGDYGKVVIGAGSTPATNVEVRATATLNGIAVPMSIFGDLP